MPLVLDFDVDVFKVLSSGPSSYIMLKDELQKLQRNKVIKDEYLIRRLSYMRKMNLIKSRKFADTRTGRTMSMYCLLEGALEHLYEHHYNLDLVRYGYIPEPKDARHEHGVTGVVRALKKEALRIGYKLSIIDERSLRELPENRKRALPDLFVVIVVETGLTERIERRYNIEIDMGTIKPKMIVDKIKRSPHKTIMLCNRSERIEKLQAAFQEAYHEMEKIKEKVRKDPKIRQKDLVHAIIFGTISDFSSNALVSGTFHSIFNNQRPIFADHEASSLKRNAGLAGAKAPGGKSRG